MNNNFCQSCGEKLENNPNFCPSCGAKLETLSTEKKTKKSPIKAKKQEVPKKSNSYFILAMAFLFAIVAIILVNNSNTKAFQKKLNSKASQNQSPAQGPDANQMMNTIQELRKQLDADPENYELNVRMGNSFFDIGRFPDAINHYQKALDVNDSDPNVLIDLGVAYFNTNSADSALIYMSNALKIDPTHSQGLYNSGIVYFNRGDSLEAVKMWEKLIETNSQSPQAATAKKFIDQIKSKITN